MYPQFNDLKFNKKLQEMDIVFSLSVSIRNKVHGVLNFGCYLAGNA